jgi:hypothetical protein
MVFPLCRAKAGVKVFQHAVSDFIREVGIFNDGAAEIGKGTAHLLSPILRAGESLP